MTTILAIETSGVACSVALHRDGGVFQLLETAPREHARKVLPMVDELLRDARVTLDAVDVIAYARGPGSFTGLRIGFGIVQGLAFARAIPVIGISTLRALAFKAAREFRLSEGLAAVALDARMGEIYWGLYQLAGDQLPATVVGDCAVTAEGALASLPQPATIAVGDGWPLINSSHVAPLSCHPDFFLDAATLAEMGAQLVADGQQQDIFSAELTYVRNEISWKKRVKLRAE